MSTQEMIATDKKRKITMGNQEKTSKDSTPRLLAQSTAKFHINAPTSDIDVSEWLFNVDELEYINCTPHSRAHLSAGSTHSPDGKRMSINVEDIGGALVIQHYHEAISEKLHCRVVSTSDLLIGREYSTADVVWELIATPVNGVHHEFVNNVLVHATEKFEQYMEAHKVPYEEVRRSFQTALDAHNAEETPFFAVAIERKALKKKS
jgi:hypothetical protein